MALFRTDHTTTHRYAVCAVLIAGLIGIEIGITRTTTFSQHPLPLSIGILFDCTVLTTAFFYGLVARPLQLPISRTVLFALTMLRVALFIVPTITPSLRVIWPLFLSLLEGVVLVITVIRFHTISQTYRALRPFHSTTIALHSAFSAVFGLKMAHIILSEGQVIYYALFNWRGTVNMPADAVAVTTHRESGQLAMLIGLLGVGLIEVTAMHLLLAMWSETVAFWVTLVSFYGCLMLLAIINTTWKRPSFRTETALHLRLDLRWQAVISRNNIAAIRRIFEKPAQRPGLLNAALVTAPNVLITLREPVEINGLYGLSRTVTQISLFVDDAKGFAVYCLPSSVGFAHQPGLADQSGGTTGKNGKL